jgi:hypothetical protein
MDYSHREKVEGKPVVRHVVMLEAKLLHWQLEMFDVRFQSSVRGWCCSKRAEQQLGQKPCFPGGP